MGKWCGSSRTIICNSMVLLTAALTAVTGTDLIRDNPTATAIIVVVVAAMNLALRFLTVEPVSVTRHRT